MAIAYASWTHGHSMSIEHPDRLASVWRTASFGRITGRAGVNTWIHFAVPTPVIVNDNHLRVGSVSIRFRTSPTDAWLGALHVYDGETRIGRYDNLREVSEEGEWVVRSFPVTSSSPLDYGIGISVNVFFHLDTASADGQRIDFSSVGCDFLPALPRINIDPRDLINPGGIIGRPRFNPPGS